MGIQCGSTAVGGRSTEHTIILLRITWTIMVILLGMREKRLRPMKIGPVVESFKFHVGGEKRCINMQNHRVGICSGCLQLRKFLCT